MKRSMWIIMIVVLLGLAVLMFLRLRSGEDTWMCQDGSWIKHGNPASLMPSEPCGI
ncbi:MAG: hypothetical protein NTX91_03885 [candidate division SR1 bacterium]|nr:hypothetical protein [candidate division SR1 bacterium]